MSTVSPGFAHRPGDPLKPGFNLYSKQQDIEIGKQAAATVRQRYQQVQSPDLQAYVKKIGERLAKTPTASSSGFPFSFTLLNYKEVNAFALPGGPTFVFTGLLKASDSEAELAGVLALDDLIAVTAQQLDSIAQVVVAERTKESATRV